MTLANRFPSHTRIGRVLRMPLRLVPPDWVVPVVRGPMRGTQWIVGSSNHGCWLGNYEREVQGLLQQTLKEGATFFDIGANVGCHSLLASRLVGRTGHVVAFEPVPANVLVLKRHVDLNHSANVRIIQAAAGDRDGEASFMLGPNNAMGCLEPTGGLTVQVVTIDSLVAVGAIPSPNVVKIDVEGSATGVLAGAERTLEAGRPVIFLALHSTAESEGCSQILSRLGYCDRVIDVVGGNTMWIPA